MRFFGIYVFWSFAALNAAGDHDTSSTQIGDLTADSPHSVISNAQRLKTTQDGYSPRQEPSQATLLSYPASLYSGHPPSPTSQEITTLASGLGNIQGVMEALEKQENKHSSQNGNRATCKARDAPRASTPTNSPAQPIGGWNANLSSELSLKSSIVGTSSTSLMN